MNYLSSMKYWAKILLVLVLALSFVIPSEALAKEETTVKEKVFIFDPTVKSKSFFTPQSYQAFLDQNRVPEAAVFRKLDKQKQKDIVSIMNDSQALSQIFDAVNAKRTRTLNIKGKQVKITSVNSDVSRGISAFASSRTISTSASANLWGFTLFRVATYVTYEYSGTTVTRILDKYNTITDYTPISWTSTVGGWISNNMAYGRGTFYATFEPIWYVKYKKTAVLTVWGNYRGKVGSSFWKSS